MIIMMYLGIISHKGKNPKTSNLIKISLTLYIKLEINPIMISDYNTRLVLSPIEINVEIL